MTVCFGHSPIFVKTIKENTYYDKTRKCIPWVRSMCLLGQGQRWGMRRQFVKLPKVMSPQDTRKSPLVLIFSVFWDGDLRIIVKNFTGIL